MLKLTISSSSRSPHFLLSLFLLLSLLVLNSKRNFVNGIFGSSLVHRETRSPVIQRDLLDTDERSNNYLYQQLQTSCSSITLKRLNSMSRGGGTASEENYNDYDEVEEEEEDNEVDESEEEDSLNTVEEISSQQQHPEKERKSSSIESTSNRKEEESKENTCSIMDHQQDFGDYLSKTYGVSRSRNEHRNVGKKKKSKAKTAIILDGSLSDALNLARKEARLLVILIPSSQKSDSKIDQNAVLGFLSSEVNSVAEGKARKGTKKSRSIASAEQEVNISDQKAFILWSTKAGSTEATNAIKRIRGIQIKHPNTGKKRPVLAVVYPAGNLGKVFPKLLAQHHCSPPPTPEIMAGWLNALRKRHAKQYHIMQTERVEIELYKKRLSGYVGSIQSDIERKEREKEEEEKRKQQEKAAKEHLEHILQRREELKQSLPDEPSSTEKKETVITIALRFADGRTGQRRFILATATLGDIFNWIDAYFDIEREHVVLHTMPKAGSALTKSTVFHWVEEDAKIKLADLNFSRMTALRVTVATKSKD